jgi:hypothetical protein
MANCPKCQSECCTKDGQLKAENVIGVRIVATGTQGV